MIDWIKDDEAITDYSWTRFEVNKKVLKISDVMLEDTGIYRCKGTNGYGSTTIRIDLIVIGKIPFEVHLRLNLLWHHLVFFKTSTENAFSIMCLAVKSDHALIDCKQIKDSKYCSIYTHFLRLVLLLFDGKK